MYIPQGAIRLDKLELPQIRLGIQGYPKTGKTYSAATFPNPTVVSLDRGLGAHIGRSDMLELPFYSDEFCRSVYKPYKDKTFLKDALLHWLTHEGVKLEPDQTLIWDGGTGTQNAFHTFIEAPENRPTTKQGAIDDYAPWRFKIGFFTELCETFKSLKCHVIYICHEADKKEKSGEYLGKVRPLLTGQFQDQLVSHFTDWVRQLTCDIPSAEKVPNDVDKNWGMPKKEFLEMCETFKPGRTLYYWQLEGDNIFDGGVSSLVNFPRYIPAGFQHFIKYLRKVNK